MGCRTRTISNIYDPENEIVTGRGNLFFVTINLPRLAIKAKHDLKVFYNLLDKKSEYSTLQEELDNLIRGTEEWREKLLQANSAVL